MAKLAKKPKQKSAPPRPKPRSRSAPTHAALAKSLGVSKRCLEGYFERGCPRGPLDAIRVWKFANVRKRPGAAAAAPAEEHSLADLQRAKLREEIRAKRLKNAEVRGRLVNRAEVARSMNELILRIKTRLQSVPDEMEMLFPADVRAEYRAAVAERMFLVLKELAAPEILAPCRAAS